MEINLEELAEFLVKAKKATYAGNGREVNPERPGFTELEYMEGDWYYRDSYTGYYSGFGDEIVRFKNASKWAMSYRWALPDWAKEDSEKIFSFLKKKLLLVEQKYPFRGPVDENYPDGRIRYRYFIDITPKPSILPTYPPLINFYGTEKIVGISSNKPFYHGKFFGGLIIPKQPEGIFPPPNGATD